MSDINVLIGIYGCAFIHPTLAEGTPLDE